MGGQADDLAVQALGGLADGLRDLAAGDELDARGDATRGGLGRDEGALIMALGRALAPSDGDEQPSIYTKRGLLWV